MLTTDQWLIFAILAGTVALFIHGRLRHDFVAFLALLACVVAGLIAGKDAFLGFGDPAVITVALVLVMSKSIQTSGAVSAVAKPLLAVSDRPLLFMSALLVTGAVLSGFMNNVGALALLLPLALQTKIPPAMLLMPLSFGTILGGLTTLIGTPPNLIVASYRQSLTGQSFGLFDFAWVGLPTAVVGVLFVVLLGWRLLPRRGEDRTDDQLFELADYIAEVEVRTESKAVGRTPFSLEQDVEGDFAVVGILRGGSRMLGNVRLNALQGGDVILVRADADTLEELVKVDGLSLAGDQSALREDMRSDDVGIVEAVITRASRLVRRTPRGLFLRRRYGLNVLGIAREGQTIRSRIGFTTLQEGDVILLQGDREALRSGLSELGLLPLADRDLRLSGKTDWNPLLFFAGAVLLTLVGLVPLTIALGLGVAGLVLVRSVNTRTVYDAVDWPVVVLLAAMIPVGGALQTTDGTGVIAGWIVMLASAVPPVAVLAALLFITMTLSDLMNNAATAVVMAPIAAGVATQLGLPADAFLMAVAVGASCAFLTPIGHQNNLLVMGPGGYKFGDYWRMGLPLEIVVIATSVPLIAWFWGL